MFQKRIDTIREELALIEREILEPQEKASRHGATWSAFEKDTLTTAFNLLISTYAREFGRTRLSIILFISRHISKGMQ